MRFLAIAAVLLCSTAMAQRPTTVTDLRVFNDFTILGAQQTGGSVPILVGSPTQPTSSWLVPVGGSLAYVRHTIGEQDLQRGRKGTWQVTYPFRVVRATWSDMPQAGGVWPKNTGPVRCANGRKKLVITFTAN